MRRPEASSVPVEADGECCHAHSHTIPCSLALPVLERDGSYCGSPLPFVFWGREETDQGDWPVHVACVQETPLQPTKLEPCSLPSRRGVQWRLGSCLAYVKRSPVDIVPSAPLVGFAGSVQPCEKVWESELPAKRGETHQEFLGFSLGAFPPNDEPEALRDPLSDF